MSGNNSNEVILPTGKEVEDPDTTVEIKIKTLDSQTYTLRVNKFVPIPALKEQIASVTGVLSEQQRLICRGKVLKDDELLSAHHVEDGHTLHLVVRQPFQTAPSPAATSAMPGSGSASISASNAEQNRGNAVTHNIVFEAVNLGQGDSIPSWVTHILSSFLRNFNIGSSTTRNDSEEIYQERREHEPATSGRQDPNNNIQPSAAPRVDFGLHQAASQFPAPVQLESHQPAVIPDSSSTINEYLGLLREEFRGEGFPPCGGGGTSIASTDVESHEAGQGLPDPATLAEILTAVRQLLVEQTGPCLSLLVELLEGQASVTDAAIRRSIQSSAIRVGGILQRLGPLLLEIGRTTMTLRMGQAPQDAVVNAGPAVYVSASGPNPLMVQPFSLYPSLHRFHNGAAVGSGNGFEGQPLLPRSVDIRIHAGQTSPAARTNEGEQVATPQQQEHVDAERNSISADLIQMISELASNTSSSAQPGVRVVPIRTVVAVPAGLGHPQPDPSGSGIGMFYPILARVQHLNSGNANGASGSQASAAASHTENDGSVRQPTSEPAASQNQNLEVDDTGSLGNNDQVNDQGRFLSGLLQQIIPLIPRPMVADPDGGEATDASDDPHHPRDPPEDLSPKRQRTE